MCPRASSHLEAEAMVVSSVLHQLSPAGMQFLKQSCMHSGWCWDLRPDLLSWPAEEQA